MTAMGPNAAREPSGRSTTRMHASHRHRVHQRFAITADCSYGQTLR